MRSLSILAILLAFAPIADARGSNGGHSGHASGHSSHATGRSHSIPSPKQARHATVTHDGHATASGD